MEPGKSLQKRERRALGAAGPTRCRHRDLVEHARSKQLREVLQHRPSEPACGCPRRRGCTFVFRSRLRQLLALHRAAAAAAAAARRLRSSQAWRETEGGRGQRLVNPRLPGKPSACARPRRAQPPVLRRLRHRCISLWHRNSVRNALSSQLARAWSPWSGNESRTRMPPRSCRGCRPSRLAVWSRARRSRWFS